ncbi:unnamed protein product, partial [Mesorhabditis belari]|uniref:Innexin n=1 Tax=Mesorhabditis belari TaxID=2138241 RepID=A0AAF3EV58_9BILA
MNFLSGAADLIKPRIDDMGADRMNYCYTTIIIALFSMGLTARQYVGTPLQCWVPQQFSDAWEQYAENYCFVYNTYWVNPDSQIPGNVQDRIASQLIYYQWAPFIMGLEAFFFFSLGKVWGILNRRSGLNIESLVKTAQNADEADKTERDKGIAIICLHLEDSIKLQRARGEQASFIKHLVKLGKLDGTYLANIYLFTKLLYLFNLIAQFLAMNQFLGQRNHLWGASILSDIISGSNWEDTGNFPRIAMCDFEVRVFGGFHRYSVQCMLVLNMFNEKIFLFLFWWFVAVFFYTVLDTVQLCLKNRLGRSKVNYVRKYLTLRSTDERFVEQFCNSNFSTDIMIILRIITIHSSEFITRDVLSSLWKEFRQKIHDDLHEDFFSDETMSLTKFK